MTDLDKTSLSVVLKDGRNLGYGEFGDPKGKTVFHFHGYLGSRLEATLIEDYIKNKNVRFISIDRPGTRLSDFKKNRKLLNWPDDVIELADALGIDKFAVEGVSGGGPYSLACAYKIPGKLTKCGVIGGMGPYNMGVEGMMKDNRRTFWVIKNMHWLFKLLMWMQSRGVDNLEKMEKKMRKSLQKFPEADQKILGDPKILPKFVKEGAEAFRNGSKGPAYEGKIYTRPRGFNPEDISPDLKVELWHGEEDVNVPIAMGHAICKMVPNCTGHFYPEQGHYSIIFNFIEEIIEKLIC